MSAAPKTLPKLTRLFTDYLRTTKGLDTLLKNGRVIDMRVGKVVYEAEVLEEHSNRVGGMHGAFAALLVDSLTGAAIITKVTPSDEMPLYWSTGVTVGLNLSKAQGTESISHRYLKGAKCGETIVATAEVSKVGRTLAFATCEIRSKEHGKLLVIGQHTKYLGTGDKTESLGTGVTAE